MDKESFLDTLRQQYVEDIHEAYIECEHGDDHKIDMPKLEQLLWKLMKNAKVDGLLPKEFMDLVRSTLPDAAGQIDFTRLGKAA